MEKIQLATLLDKYFPMHGHWKGLGLGHIVQVWLAYILSEGDHRLSHVESWAGGLLITLETSVSPFFEKPSGTSKSPKGTKKGDKYASGGPGRPGPP